MKRYLKAALWVLFSFLVLFLFGISFIIWFAFTPQRLTPLVRSQLEKNLTCHSDLGSVELTFFSTFPRFGVKVDDVLLVSPAQGAPSDTLATIDQLVGVIDLAALLWRDELIISGFSMHRGSINAYVDSGGNANFNILKPTPDAEVSGEGPSFSFIDFKDLSLQDVKLTYVDDAMKINSGISGLYARVSGNYEGDNFRGRIHVDQSQVTLQMAGETFLDHASLRWSIPALISPARSFIDMKNATFHVNDLELHLSGSLERDTVSGDMKTSMDYKLQQWPLQSLRELVPASYRKYFQGMVFSGLVTSTGSITGVYNDSLVPLMDLHITLQQGKLQSDAFPLPLEQIMADINVFTDMLDDERSFVKVNQFKASTPHSALASTGMIRNLLSDIHLDMTSDVDLSLDEMQPLVPDSLKIRMKGKAEGNVKTRFSLSHLEKMLIEKMNLSGTILGTSLDISYDSVWMKTNRARIEFALPNPSASNPAFALADIDADQLSAGKTGLYQALLQRSKIALELSDVRDTTRIPTILCTFSLDSLSASMDTVFIALKKPNGKMSVEPVAGRVGEPHINLTYTGERLRAALGSDSLLIGSLQLNTEIINDESQQDVFRKWLSKGFIDLQQGRFTSAMLKWPVEIPAIRMNFDPETFDIKQGRMVIDKSDFELTGKLSNVLSYFRGDSLLVGIFNFNSHTTDILQIMNMTNGLGNEDSLKTASTDPSATSGPYIVPKGIYVELAAQIDNASFGVDTATNINGTLRVNDGILLLDQFTFATSAARMQLTAMYRTPRKNHLYLGMNYHMLDVEIEELLNIIPDIDTLMPMLRSFRGKGEFHLSVESYLDSTYNLKPSTLMGAASIKGQNLVLMDGETFGEIARTLRFNRKTENIVDSLSAEFTIFRREIDVYPFLIVMDKYKAVVAGRHNFDLTFDYHISVVDSPIPLKFGIDVKGNIDGLRYQPAAPRYAEFYRPSSRRAVENKDLELRRLIRESVTRRLVLN